MGPQHPLVDLWVCSEWARTTGKDLLLIQVLGLTVLMYPS
jgi:hypothetical protein